MASFVLGIVLFCGSVCVCLNVKYKGTVDSLSSPLTRDSVFNATPTLILTFPCH